VKLLEVVLELKVLKMENNMMNRLFGRMTVDEDGVVIEGSIEKAIRRGLVTEENSWYCWVLFEGRCKACGRHAWYIWRD